MLVLSRWNFLQNICNQRVEPSRTVFLKPLEFSFFAATYIFGDCVVGRVDQLGYLVFRGSFNRTKESNDAPTNEGPRRDEGSIHLPPNGAQTDQARDAIRSLDRQLVSSEPRERRSSLGAAGEPNNNTTTSTLTPTSGPAPVTRIRIQDAYTGHLERASLFTRIHDARRIQRKDAEDNDTK